MGNRHAHCMLCGLILGAWAASATGDAPVKFNGKTNRGATGLTSDPFIVYTSNTLGPDVSVQFLYDKIGKAGSPLASVSLRNDELGVVITEKLVQQFDTIAQECSCYYIDFSWSPWTELKTSNAYYLRFAGENGAYTVDSDLFTVQSGPQPAPLRPRPILATSAVAPTASSKPEASKPASSDALTMVAMLPFMGWLLQ